VDKLHPGGTYVFIMLMYTFTESFAKKKNTTKKKQIMKKIHFAKDKRGCCATKAHQVSALWLQCSVLLYMRSVN
jgi:hypothetical protein